MPVPLQLSSSGSWTTLVDGAAHTESPYTDTITGLTPGETYDVRMTYIDPDGVNGSNPQTVSVVMLDYETTVGTATAVMADYNTSIAISMPYTFDDDGDNTYAVEYKLSSSGTWLEWGTNPKTHTASPYTDTITGLIGGETYDVRMTYIDPDEVNGANPQTVTGILLSVNTTTAETATAIATSDTSIAISMPYDFDNNINNTYTVKYKLNSSGIWRDWGTNPKTHTTSPYTDTITGLTPGETYDVEMTYNDGDGVNGANPQTVSVTLIHNSTTVSSATATGQGETSIDITMSYTGDDNNNNTYTVKYKLGSEGSWTTLVDGAAHTASPYTDTIIGLTPGETYDAEMTYNDANGVNGANPQTVIGIILAHNSTTVGSATAAKVSETSIDVTMPYTGDNNGDNTYTVEYKLSSSGAWLDWETNPKAHATSPYTDTITGLAAGIYDVRMIYNDANGVNGANPQIVTGIELSPITGPVVRVCSDEINKTIQAGINAVTEDDTTVLVCEGTYSENITLNGTWEITVKAEGSVGNTKIQGTGSNVAVVTFNNAAVDHNTVLDGFTIDNRAAGSSTRGVYIYNGASPAIKYCIIENNKSDNQNGAGLYITGAAGGATITNSIIRRNTTGVNQGYGGGIYYNGTGALTISDSSIYSNSCKRSGGGLYMNSTTAIITGTTINSNIAGGDTGGGGIYMVGSSSVLTLSKCFVQGNRTTGYNDNAKGGGIKIASGTATITNSIIAGNVTTAYKGDGGGIYNIGTLNLYFSTITDNYVTRWGGGLGAAGAENVYNSIISGNNSGNGNPEIYGSVNTLYLTETTSNPLFASPHLASSGNPTTDGDYHLQSNSNCIDTGDATNKPAGDDDIEGNVRPTDIAGKGDGADDYDKGACEYVP